MWLLAVSVLIRCERNRKIIFFKSLKNAVAKFSHKQNLLNYGIHVHVVVWVHDQQSFLPLTVVSESHCKQVFRITWFCLSCQIFT